MGNVVIKAGGRLNQPVGLAVRATFGRQSSRVRSILSSGPHDRLQAKLRINTPGDVYEQEADRVAEQVMRMPETRSSAAIGDAPLADSRSVPPRGTIQRVCASCSEEETLIQPKRAPGGTSQAISSPSRDVESLQGGGRTLTSAERDFFEPRIGADFSMVRIHSDMRAATAARSVNARAFTVGQNIVFGAGEYSSDTSTGRKLLAHELTHTIQQKGMVQNKVQRTLLDGHDLLAERFQGRLSLEAAFDDESYVRQGSKGPDVVILQLALLDAGHALPRFGADGDFGSETRNAVIEFQRAQGLQDDGIVGPRTMEVLDALFTVGPVIAPHCNNPGVARNVQLQPVFFRCGANDADPTGGSYFTQLTKANEIWSKLGVTFTTNSAVTLNDCANKTSGTTEAEQNAIGNLHAGAGVEVYYVDNDLAGAGGGSTLSAGNASNVVLSDFGTSTTLLAHELGHVLGLNHPPTNADAGTIMQPSGSHSIENPERNTLANFAFIVFPAGTDPICLTPDP